MKRIVAVFCALFILLSFCACAPKLTDFERSGGTVIVYQADSDLNAVLVILEKRLHELGYENTSAQIDGNIITVIIPGRDATYIAEDLSRAGHLTFRHSDGTVIMDNDMLTDVYADYVSNEVGNMTPVLYFNFTGEGQAAFAQATEIAAANREGENVIDMYLDDDCIYSPRVEKPINENSCMVFMQGTPQDELDMMAILIRCGKLPVTLDLINAEYHEPR